MLPDTHLSRTTLINMMIMMNRQLRLAKLLAIFWPSYCHLLYYTVLCKDCHLLALLQARKFTHGILSAEVASPKLFLRVILLPG
jgi:hypothetical protein